MRKFLFALASLCGLTVGAQAQELSGPGVPTTVNVAQFWVDAKQYGAVFDGSSHPLSSVYGTLAAAQVVYPFVTALSQELDYAGIQAAIKYCQSKVTNVSGEHIGGCGVMLTPGTALINTGIVINKSHVSLLCPTSTTGQVGVNFGGPAITQKPDAACDLRWSGSNATAPATTSYMLDVEPLVADGYRLYGNDINGIRFDCQDVTGCSAVLIKSEMNSWEAYAVNESQPITYATSADAHSGDLTLQVANTSGIRQGDPVTGTTGIIPGNYVLAVTDGTHIKLAQTISADMLTGTQFGIGGINARYDVVGGLQEVNDSQYNNIWIFTSQFSGSATLTGPSVIFGATPTASSDGAVNHYGDFSLNFVNLVQGYFKYNDFVVYGTTDHNWQGPILGTYFGTSDTWSVLRMKGYNTQGGLNLNGHSRFNVFYGPMAAHDCFITAEGTNTGGNTTATMWNRLEHIWTTGVAGFHYPTLGTGAALTEQDEFNESLGMILGSNAAQVVAQEHDGTVAGGNTRNNGAVDLQTERSDPAQVAGAPRSSILGGNDNAIALTGTNSTIIGGAGNTMDGTYNLIGVGQNQVATSSSSQSAIIAGNLNTMNGANDLIGAGASNTIDASSQWNFIGAGSANEIGGNRNAIVAGISNTIEAGTAAATIAGGNANLIHAAGTNGFIGGGATNFVDQPNSSAFGNKADAYGTGWHCFGAGTIAGSDQTCIATVRGTTSTGSNARLTTDGLTAGSTNCLNFYAGSTIGGTITINANDPIGLKSELWANWPIHAIYQAAHHLVQTGTKPTPLTDGTVTGSDIAVSLDASPTCLDIEFTPPNSNTDTWEVTGTLVLTMTR